MTLNIAELRRLEADIDLDHPGGVVMSHSEYRLHVAMRNALPELLKALEALQRIESTACEGLEDGGYRESLIEIKYAARKALSPHGGVNVG